MTEPLLVSAAPVFEIEGEASGDLARDLIRLEIEETTAGLKTLSLRLISVGPMPGETTAVLRYLDGSILDFGKRIAVSIGPADTARTVFEGRVSAIEVAHGEGRPPEVVVLAEDDLMALRTTRRSRSHESVSDAELAEAIAAEHGLKTEVDVDGPTYDVIQQWNMSDLAFLRERARLIRAELWVLDGTLFFQQRDRRSATRLTLVQGNQLIEVRLRADLAHQRTVVKVSGYDADRRERIEEEADDAALGGEETAGGQTGAAVLRRAFGERASFRVRDVPLNADEAAALARGEMRRRARQFVTATGVTRGSPDLVVGSRLALENVGHCFEGPDYTATRVAHTYDAIDGFRTRFTAERGVLREGA